MASVIKKVARILSLDGGGIRGLIPDTIIADWEAQLGGPIANHFHMIAGTSTGGILATALSKKVAASDIQKFYIDEGPTIFKSSFGSIGGVYSELYDGQNLYAAVDKVIKGQLSDADIANDLLITTYDIQAQAPYLFKNWKAKGFELEADETVELCDFALRDACRATSAAPTYFAPADVKSISGHEYYFIDGGVYANNPAMCAYVAARRLYPKADEYLIVSLDTGSVTTPMVFDAVKSYGLAQWAKPLLDVIFNGVCATTEYELSQLKGVSQYRFKTSLAGADEAMDNVTKANLDALVNAAKKSVDANSKDMAALISRLKKEKMTTCAALGYPSRNAPPKPADNITVVPKTPILTPATATTAAGGAVAGSAFGPVGTAIGAGLGWLAGKITS